MLAVEKHRGFVLLAFADDHNAIEVDGLEEGAHGVDGGAVGLVLVPEAHPVAAGNCRGFGDADKFQCKVAVRLVDPDGKRRGKRGVLLGHGRWCHVNLFFEWRSLNPHGRYRSVAVIRLLLIIVAASTQVMG